MITSYRARPPSTQSRYTGEHILRGPHAAAGHARRYEAGGAFTNDEFADAKASTRAAPTTDSATATSTSSAPSSSPPAEFTAAPVDRTQRARTSALVMLGNLMIKGRAAKTAYEREQFGAAWTDNNNDPLGHNGSDTRLIRTGCEGFAREVPSNGAIRATESSSHFAATKASNGEGTP